MPPIVRFGEERHALTRPLVVGRDVTCDVLVDDTTLSRRHACFAPTTAGPVVIDLNSRNGTTVNGNPVQLAFLRDGDTIGVGNRNLSFHGLEDSPGPGDAPLVPAQPLSGEETVEAAADVVDRALKENTLKLLRSGQLRGDDPTTRLLILYKVARSINACLDADELLQKVVALAIEVLHADRALIALAGDENGHLDGPRFRGGEGADETAVQAFSTSIAAECFSRGETLVITDAQGDLRFKGSESVSRLNIGAAICAPLIHRDVPLGVLYVDRRIDARGFGPGDVKMLAALAEQAALALANGRLYEDLRASLRREELQRDALIHAEKLAAMGTLSAGVSHEIRNPLTVIMGNLELALSGRIRGEEETREMLEAAARAADAIHGIVQGLVDFSRKRPTRPEALDANELIERTLVAFRSTLTRKYGVAVTLDLQAGLPHAFGDRGGLVQVLMNLILNAVQAMDEGGNLTLRSRPGDRSVEIEVLDTGPGLPPERLADLFKPFVTGKPDGTGLGLWISREIVERCGGTISAGNPPEGGARFLITLPVAP